VKIDGAVIVVTGAASGIGAGLVRRFVADGARAVIVTDLDQARCDAVASQAGPPATGRALDVTDETAVAALVSDVIAEHGRIDLFCSNAGIPTGVGIEGGPEADLAWLRAWQIHVMAHVFAARAVVPAMIEAGGGYLLNTASAAGLLSSPGDAPYTATKHAAVGFAEWLAYQYLDRGIKVSVLCPMGVDTPLLMDGLGVDNPAAKAVAASGTIISVDAVADAVVAGLDAETFLILPHAEVGKFWAGKAANPDHWIAAMAQLAAGVGTTK